MTREDIDPARIGRLRSQDRLAYVDPAKLIDLLDAGDGSVIADIGAGVGFVTLPLARRFPRARILACDIVDGMLALLREDATAAGLDNVRTVTMPDGTLPLEADSVDCVTMLQVHHELDAPHELLAECLRVTRPGGGIYIVDWLNQEGGPVPAGGRRVAPEDIAAQLEAAGFEQVTHHDVYAHHSCVTATAPT